MVDRQHCTGCSACAAGCPTGAIRMEPDSEGFLQPRIRKEQCTGCGLCQRICPAAAPRRPEAMQKAYLVYAKDEALRKASSSGGIFTLLAEGVIKSGGVVFGCAMTGDCRGARHTEVESFPALELLRGSKYVQSDVGDTLRRAKEAVLSGRQVLFTGTPCQIAGLRALLGDREYENLLLADVICHGVPSPLVWEAYVRQREQEAGAKVRRICFRDKITGWKQYSLTMEFENGSCYSSPVTQDPYLRCFIQNLYLRRSCYHCEAKAGNYRSDITLGDFWGVRRLNFQLEQSIGVSLAVAHTTLGESRLQAVARNCFLEPVDFETALKSNPSYFYSASANGLRNTAIRRIAKKGTKHELDRYCGDSFFAKCGRKIGQIFGG